MVDHYDRRQTSLMAPLYFVVATLQKQCAQFLHMLIAAINQLAQVDALHLTIKLHSDTHCQYQWQHVDRVEHRQ